MLNSHRHTNMPTSATSAATMAVATPPGHSCPASTFGRGGVSPFRGVIGSVMGVTCLIPACVLPLRA